MTQPARRVCYLLPAIALMVIAGPCAAFANSDGYLNWSSKAQPANTPAQTEQVNTATGAYPVPPSPYGQVGDPYARSLRWPAKQATAVASVSPPSPPDFAPVPAPPVRMSAPVSISQPVPMRAPQPVAVVPLPAAQQPVPQAEREDPGLADDPGMADDAPMTAPAPKTRSLNPAPAVASIPSRPRTDSAPPPPATVAPALTNALATDGAYEVPATSKYAARIAAARAAQLPVAEAPKGKADAKPTATAPEPDVSLASQETDHVFIPGEQYKTPADEPRLYSLHRQYGMRPDPIQVTPGATGALLTVSPEEGGDPNDDDTANDAGKKSDTDKN